MFVVWLLEVPATGTMNLRDGSAEKIVHAATLRQMLAYQTYCLTQGFITTAWISLSTVMFFVLFCLFCFVVFFWGGGGEGRGGERRNGDSLSY